MKSYDFGTALSDKAESNHVIMALNGSAKANADDTEGNNEETPKGIGGFIKKNEREIKIGRNILFLIVYLAYYGYAMYCHFGDEPSIRLTVFTTFGVVCIIWRAIRNQETFSKAWKSFRRQLYNVYTTGKRPKIIRWYVYVYHSKPFP